MNKALEARTVEELIRFSAQGKQPKYIYFWGHTPKVKSRLDNACFSQWFSAPFTVDNREYPTAEHYMMAEKAKLFGDENSRDRILCASSPGAAKAIGREVRGFDETEWIKHRFEIVVAASVEKFSSCPDLTTHLMGTTKRVLVEASPVDRVWGIGLDVASAKNKHPSQWKGLNLLGFALMEARERIHGNAV